jgi:hypothetical protein
MENIFNSFFSDVSTICGHEANLQANFMHQLISHGAPIASITREYHSGHKQIDLVLSALEQNGKWMTCNDPAVAFEFKGGAYGTRNALYDVIDSSGCCTDLKKLSELRNKGLECWFVCCDMAALGIALTSDTKRRLAGQCKRLGIHFAYHAQDQDHYLISRADGPMMEIKLNGSKRVSLASAHWQDGLQPLTSLLCQPNFTEHTAVGMIYHALICSGFEAEQISLETYFSCAKAGRRMQIRPDICIFADGIHGRFNLYRGGDPRISNDRNKLGQLKALIEVKGSQATAQTSEKTFAKQVSKDIDKLGQWMARFEASGYLASDVAAKPDYIMIILDNRKVPLSTSLLDILKGRAREKGIHLRYKRIEP